MDIFRRKWLFLNTKSAKCDKFSKIFLGKDNFARIMGDIDNLGNNKNVC
jgi:hypothetical protein